jgi:hypothetical protein
MSEPDSSESRPVTAVPDDDELERGRQALARLAEAERELALARHHSDAKVAELEERLGWFEENELDIREQVERHPWLRACVRVWSFSVRLVRKLSRLVRR